MAQDLSKFENFPYYVVVCKTLKFVLHFVYVPLEGLCYLFSIFFFRSTSLGPISLRYDSAAAVCQSNDSARLGEFKARRGKSPRGAVVEGPP